MIIYSVNAKDLYVQRRGRYDSPKLMVGFKKFYIRGARSSVISSGIENIRMLPYKAEVVRD